MSKTTLHLPADAAGPRGISTKEHGDVLLSPGEVREGLTLSDEELERADSNDLVEGKPKAKEEKADRATERKTAEQNKKLGELRTKAVDARRDATAKPEDTKLAETADKAEKELAEAEEAAKA
jgi:hypothetical protein